MGHLDFSDLDVRMLGLEHAVVTGRFHLTRSAAGGGDASGVFSLVFEKKASEWKIILDHTSS
jgi:ketosteroid isomerase-like protein